MEQQKIAAALLSLLGDDDVKIARTARSRLLWMGEKAIPVLEENLNEQTFKTRIRAMNLINRIQLSRPRKRLSPYIEPARK